MKPYVVKKARKRRPEPAPRDSIFLAENRDAYEVEVFKKAVYFTVAHRAPHRRGDTPRWIVKKFNNYPAALAAAGAAPNLILYAVGGEDIYSLSVPLGRKSWPAFLELWNTTRS